MKKIAYALLLTVFLFGCAGKNIYKDDWKTRIDPGTVTAQFDADHETCSDLAWASIERERQERIGRVVIGAVAGATLGIVTAAILGRGAGTKVAQKVAGMGALYGAAAAAGSVQDRSYAIYGNCMRNRGYQILW